MDENRKQEYTYFLGTLAEMIHQHKQTNGEEGFDFETAAQQALNLQVIDQPTKFKNKGNQKRNAYIWNKENEPVVKTVTYKLPLLMFSGPEAAK